MPLLVAASLVTALVLVGAVVVGVKLADPSPSPGTYSSLPNPCSMGSVLPQSLASFNAGPIPEVGNNSRTLKTCEWKESSSPRFDELDVDVWLQLYSYPHTAHHYFDMDITDESFCNHLSPVSGLGDEAFSCIYNTDPATPYGADVWIRAGNATIEVDWSDIRDHDASYRVTNRRARSQAIAMAKHLLGELK